MTLSPGSTDLTALKPDLPAVFVRVIAKALRTDTRVTEILRRIGVDKILSAAP